MKLLEVKVHYHEIKVCYMSSWFRRIMNYFRRFMKLVTPSSNMSWKVHEVAWSLHEIDFALQWCHLTKGASLFVIMKCRLYCEASSVEFHYENCMESWEDLSHVL